LEVKQMNAREQIVRVLEEVFEQGAYSNIALNQALEHSQLSDKDRSFVTEVVYGTVARKITLEWYLAHVIEDRTKLDPWLYYLLMMSLYQLVYLDRIPDHAIVNEAVQIAKRRKEGSEKFVNAILRKLLREGLPAVDTIKRKNKRYSVQYSLPVWLVKELIEEYGEERACAIFKSLSVFRTKGLPFNRKTLLVDLKNGCWLASITSDSIWSRLSILKFVYLYIPQNLHLLWVHPLVTCRRSDLYSFGGLYICSSYFILFLSFPYHL